MLRPCVSCKDIGDTADFIGSRKNICKPCGKKRNAMYRKKYMSSKKHRKTMRDAINRWRAIPENNQKLKVLRDKWARTMDGLFPQAKSIAKKSGRVWEISRSDYEHLRSKRCNYCEGPLPETGLGLDRLDNTLGYELNNVVPCCTLCNMARRNQFTPNEMKVFIGPAIKKIRESRQEVTMT